MSAIFVHTSKHTLKLHSTRRSIDTPMKRKPDLMWLLVIIFGLGVVTTGYTQSLRDRSTDQQQHTVYQVQSISASDTKTGQSPQR